MTKLLSIVSITKNDLIGIARTITSIKGDLLSKVELLVVAPMDDTAFNDYPFDRVSLKVRCIEQIDAGIYSAMNLGLRSAVGEFVVFMNGGDEFYNLDHNLKSIEKFKDSDLLFFDTIEQDYEVELGTNWFYKVSKNIPDIDYGMPTHHQSIAYRTRIAKQVMYDEKFKYAGDYDFTARYIKKSCTSSIINYPMSIFHLNGVSQTAPRREIFTEVNLIKRDILGQNFLKRNLFFIKQHILHYLRKYLGKMFKRIKYSSGCCKICLSTLCINSGKYHCPNCNRHDSK